MAYQNSPKIVTSGLILCADASNSKSYPGSGTTWSSLTRDNDGVLTNGPTFDSANNGSISFDGSNDLVDFSKDLGTLENYTIMYWARRDVENRMPVAGRLNTNFYWYGDNSWYYTHGGVGGEYYYSKPTTISLGTWGCYCVVYDGSYVNIYRQSVFQGRQATTGSANWSQGLRVGYWTAGGSYAWQGLISNVTMYSRALTQSEILQNFNAIRGRYSI